jgi:flagellar protein FlbD
VIQLTHFNGGYFYLNPDIIQTVEATPDTVITLINNQKILVKDKTDEVVNKIIAYQRAVRNPDLSKQVGDA